ncbi:MAG: hypothetical protein ABGY95_09045 [Rubritalea sp.]|uniref:hypothetical protein n=1 Tax=Rubritalea sp. TaxID=2109375 RepID=UPI003241EB1F
MNNKENRSMKHDELVEACRSAAAKLDHREVGRAFVASFSTRRLDWRGVLSCYAVCRQLANHEFIQSPIFGGGKRGSCSICGLASPEFDINVSGRVLESNLGRAYYIESSLTSLEQFALAEKPNPTNEDIELFMETINRLRNRDETKLGQLQKLIQGLFPSNKYEREDILGSLALAGIFKLDAASYMDSWVTYDVRESVMPSHFYAKDSPHPLRHYKSTSSLDEKAITFWFADLTQQQLNKGCTGA